MGGGRFTEVWVRGLAVWLTSILSVSRTVLLWFGPQDTMQTIPQPCKAWGRPGWAEVGGRPSRPSSWDVPPPSSEPCGAGLGQRQAEGVRHGEGMGWHDLFFPSRGFCFFNSVAIACRQLQQQGKASKILIVDWVGPRSWPLQVREPCGKSPEPGVRRHGFTSCLVPH